MRLSEAKKAGFDMPPPNAEFVMAHAGTGRTHRMLRHVADVALSGTPVYVAVPNLLKVSWPKLLVRANSDRLHDSTFKFAGANDVYIRGTLVQFLRPDRARPGVSWERLSASKRPQFVMDHATLEGDPSYRDVLDMWHKFDPAPIDPNDDNVDRLYEEWEQTKSVGNASDVKSFIKFMLTRYRCTKKSRL